MKLHRNMVCVVLVVLCAGLVLAPAAIAEERGEEPERHVVVNPEGGEAATLGPTISFDEFVASIETSLCSGACNCSICVCSGSESRVTYYTGSRGSLSNADVSVRITENVEFSLFARGPSKAVIPALNLIGCHQWVISRLAQNTYELMRFSTSANKNPTCSSEQVG